MLVPWLVGFVAYQLINPGYVVWWADGCGPTSTAGCDFTPATLDERVHPVLRRRGGRDRPGRPAGVAARGDRRRADPSRRSLRPSRRAGRSSRSRARSSATACRGRTTCASRARSRTAVRAGGAVPATIAVVDGAARIGLDDAALERVAGDDDVVKVSVRDLATVAARGGVGATTVASTAHLAARGRHRVFATGGLGGVHRGARETWDESADLTTLSRTPVLVVCAGVKSILDVGATLERLETLNVGVLGYRTDRFPGFYLRDSGHRAATGGSTPRPRSPRCCARPARARHRRLRSGAGQPDRPGRRARPRRCTTARPGVRAGRGRRRRRARQGRHPVPARLVPPRDARRLAGRERRAGAGQRPARRRGRRRRTR